MRAHRTGISDALESIVARCLAKDPSARFGSGAELRRALEALTGGEAQTIRHGADDAALPFATTQADLPRAETTARRAREMQQRPPRRAERRSIVIFVLSVLVVVALGIVGVIVLAKRTSTRSLPVGEDAAPVVVAASVATSAVDDDAPEPAPELAADAASGTPVQAPTTASPRPRGSPNHVTLASVGDLDPGATKRWFARMQPELDACVTTLPCFDLQVDFADQVSTSMPRAPARMKASCRSNGTDVHRCAVAVLRSHLPLPGCSDGAPCRGALVLTFDTHLTQSPPPLRE
jgi:hypothetical protein